MFFRVFKDESAAIGGFQAFSGEFRPTVSGSALRRKLFAGVFLEGRFLLDLTPA
jgi:hypothetical protein